MGTQPKHRDEPERQYPIPHNYSQIVFRSTSKSPIHRRSNKARSMRNYATHCTGLWARYERGIQPVDKNNWSITTYLGNVPHIHLNCNLINPGNSAFRCIIHKCQMVQKSVIIHINIFRRTQPHKYCALWIKKVPEGHPIDYGGIITSSNWSFWRNICH